jgi:hypothetical protein
MKETSVESERLAAKIGDITRLPVPAVVLMGRVTPRHRESDVVVRRPRSVSSRRMQRSRATGELRRGFGVRPACDE